MRHNTTPPLLSGSSTILLCAIILASHFTVATGAAHPARSQSESASKSSILRPQEKKRIVTWRRRETDRGPIITLTSDTSLNDYISYAESDRFFVRIPQASLASARSGLGDHGAANMLVEEGRDDVVISVKILQGSTVRVRQSFNRLELIVLIHDQPKG